MTIYDHLKGTNPETTYLAVAYGRHLVTGQCAKSSKSGTSPAHVLTLQQFLGVGPWDSVENVYYSGLRIDPSKYVFHPGPKATGATTSTVFAADVPHSLKAWIEVELPSGVGVDPATGVPDGLTGIYKTRICADYDAGGIETDPGSYTANPARIVADLLIKVGGIDPARIDWAFWVAWRDFCEDPIPHDYTAIAGFRGFGLTGRYYSDATFATLLTKRVDPYIDLVSTAGSGAPGQPVDNFSIKWTGYIRPKYSETFTFKALADTGAKVTVGGTVVINNLAGPAGTFTGTKALTAGTFYPITVEFVETTGSAQMILKWSSASVPEEVVPDEVLYPETEDLPRYEIHPFWNSPTRLDDALRTCLYLCNSTYQEANGKLRFFAFDQLTSSGFSLTNDNIVDGSLVYNPRDVSSVRNFWTAKMRDLDSQYIEEPTVPVTYELEDLVEAAGRRIEGDTIEFYNSNRHQVYRVLKAIADRASKSRFTIELDALSDTLEVLAGDRVSVEIEFLDLSIDCLVTESTDASAEGSADERKFTLKEWV